MTLENSLIQKTYYETFTLEADKVEHPANVLGNLYFSEQKKEIPDLSNIRFAQGEVYFQMQDFEAAIYKWENIQNELEPWAKKNMADAYLELELFETAENLYRSISTDSLTLNTEITLQLFELYLSEQRIAEADQMMKHVVVLNPSYPNVTTIARAFFEEQNDWESAVDLAVNEAVRTKSLEWFQLLSKYAKAGHITKPPGYFISALTLLASIDMKELEKLLVDLWSSYQKENTYFTWLQEINSFLNDNQFDYQWKQLPTLYQSAYMKMVSGKYSISVCKDIAPDLLKAWINIASSSTAFAAAASLLAWNDLFSEYMEEEMVSKAEALLADSQNEDQLFTESVTLFRKIQNWADGHKIHMDESTLTLIGQMSDLSNQYVLFNDQSTIDRYQDRVTNNEKALPQSLSILYVPENKWASHPLTRLADHCLFTLNTNAPFTHDEQLVLIHIKEQLPELHIDFMLRSESPETSLDDLRKNIQAYFPVAHVFDIEEQWLESIRDQRDEWKRKRVTRLLAEIRRLLAQLIEQQVIVEQELIKSVDQDEDILGKLKGSIHQLDDLVDEKKRVIKEAFQTIKYEIKAEFEKTIPEIIKNTSEIIKDDSDFKTIHIALNEEMNKRIASYIEENVMPIYASSLQDWISFSKNEFELSQEQLSEWEQAFNAMLAEERIHLSCDFQVLNDWRRDADRMTSAVHIEQENIMLRRTPSQVLLKGAGKLLGVLPKNNTVLTNTFKNFIQNESFQETATAISTQFFQQFELFEKAIERDIQIFFREPIAELEKMVEEIKAEKEENQSALAEMTSNPEAFRGPLRLFEVRLRQYEWMDYAEQVKVEMPVEIKIDKE
ncbi:GTP-binding protein [Bacillus sp. FJAT-50079]|uniref:tetratricopeptide repeat protein n=1 Tax=Bacillus sp. FJAT-50079 TaxID=2833577 RepID=UPI001BC8E662|nr:GTP-binding protein [Bacillus sp. FJAT-50079]MBS4209306.1 GTP-binding protein [Bacillus sp. FJAT-50079]